MRSLRLQLLLGTALGTTAVLLVSGAVLYALISRTLRAGFDQSLAAKARSLAALAEQDNDGLEFELTEVPLPEFEPSDHAEYYQAWLSDGVVFCAHRPCSTRISIGSRAHPAIPPFRRSRCPTVDRGGSWA